MIDKKKTQYLHIILCFILIILGSILFIDLMKKELEAGTSIFNFLVFFIILFLIGGFFSAIQLKVYGWNIKRKSLIISLLVTIVGIILLIISIFLVV